MDPLKFDFRRVADTASQGLVVTPILMSYLHNASYPDDFVVRFTNHGEERRPDDWFHPSTHPLMTERQLYLYLKYPEKWIPKPIEFAGALSITFGTAVHGFVQMCLSPENANILVSPTTDVCPVCFRWTGWGVDDCNEHGVVDEKTRSRGHMDGVLNIPDWGMAGFEFKTSNLMKVSNSKEGDVEGFRKKWPEYYAQVQDYMRISGLRKFVVFFLGLGYPWTTREFIIEYDPLFCFQLENKYLFVRRSIEQDVIPLPCCTMHSTTSFTCAARNCCPVGLGVIDG